MNSISEQLLAAMELVVEDKISKLEYDKTIQATVYSIVNADTGEYKVRYSGNIFSAFSASLEDTYKVDENVYVTVPEGDFSQRKIITSSVTGQSLTQNQLASLQNSFYEISPSFEVMYDVEFADGVGVVAGAPVDSSLSHVNICPVISDKENVLFRQYANNYELIRIKGSFLTEFQDIHVKGNYGLRVTFYTLNGGEVSYCLDQENFNGDPYNFVTYAQQEVTIKVQKGYIVGLKSIELFVEDFNYDCSYSYELDTDNNIITVTTENKDTPNIFVKDVSIQYVEQRDLSDSNYYLFISPLKGVAFNSKVTYLEMLGRLVYQGSDVISKADSIQWYVRDLGVMIGDEAYNKDVGVGWRAIEGATEPKLTIGVADVRKQEKYKLVVSYKDSNLTAETEVFNLNNTVEYAIAQTTAGDGATSLSLTNSALVGDWYVQYPDSAYQEVALGVNGIDVTSYLSHSAVTFYVTVYQDGERLGTLDYTIRSSEEQADLTVTYEGEDQFRYDANGDISVEDSDKERTLQANLTWKDNQAVGCNATWLLKNGTEIPKNKSNAISPEGSMLTKLWVDNNNILHYNLKQKYKITLVNNIVRLKITTYTGLEYTFDKEIICLKDGDQGTNGTTYVAAVRPCDSFGDKLSGFQALRYNNGWQDTMHLKCYVYKDGERIDEDSNYQVTYKWTGYNVLLNNVAYLEETVGRATVRGISTISADTSAANLSFYTTIQIDITDNTKHITIYTSYPIDVLVGDGSFEDIDISTIPSYVKYTSSGSTPSYYSTALNYTYQGIEHNDIKSLDTTLLGLREYEGKKYLNPTSSFLYENIATDESNIGVLECALPAGRVIHPVVMYLDTYGNEAINGWDGTAIKVNDDKTYIFAPQVGAGKKESDNTFTGVVMGQDSGQGLIGLYGYQAGVNTFGLKQDGTAFFGKGEMIKINGEDATIQGGNGGDSLTGMTITLANLDSAYNGEAIKLGAGAFKVMYDGSMTATSGEIGGWKINSSQLYKGYGSNNIGMGKGTIIDNSTGEYKTFWSTNKFYITSSGRLYCEDAYMRGEIDAETGLIGGWEIDSSGLRYANGKIVLSHSSGIKMGSAFKVTTDGQMSCKKGDIGGWSISSSALTSADKTIILDSSENGGITAKQFKIIGLGSASNQTGYVGLIKGEDDHGTTYNLGLDTSSAKEVSIILNSGYQIALRGGTTYIQTNALVCKVDADKQSGIYARFA